MADNGYIEEYLDAIKRQDPKDGIVGYWVRKEVENIYEDKKSGIWHFDTTEADKRMAFQEKFSLQSKAPFYGKPMDFMLWQKFFWSVIYGFYDRKTGYRRFTDVLLEIARKNGKSTTLASDANYDVFVGAGGNDICCASNDDGQAKLIWQEVAQMRNMLDPRKTITSHNLTTIRNHYRNISVTRLSQKTQNKDGRNYAKVYLDESHDINEIGGGSEIAEACWRSMSTKDDPLFINCTTNGFNRDCYLDNKIRYGKKVINGEIEDPQFFPLLFEMDSEEEIWTDESSWAKANPALPYGVKKIAKLRRDVETAKHDKASRIHLLTKDFNMPQDGTESWLLYEDYAYKTNDFSLDDFKGAFCLGFVDLSATTDLTSAKALLMRPNDTTKYIVSHYWTLQSKLEEIDWKEHGADYRQWVRDGYMTVHDGTEIDIAEVADWYFMLYKNYNIKPYMIGYDQRFSKVFTDRLDEYQLEYEMILQGRALSNAMRLTEADLKAKRINYNQNPVDKWCLKNCSCKMDNVGFIQPVKTQAEKRIDGAITFIGINEVYRRYRAEYEQLINQI